MSTQVEFCSKHDTPRIRRSSGRGWWCRECYSEWRKNKHKDDPRRAMLMAARHRAKVQGVPFELTLDDIVIPPLCPVLGIELRVAEDTRTDNSPTLDKVVPKLGYVPGNVKVISYRANRLKCDATVEELEAVIRYMKGESC